MSRPSLLPRLLFAASAGPLLAARAPAPCPPAAVPVALPMPVGDSAPPPVAVDQVPDPLAGQIRQFYRHALYANYYATLATGHYRWTQEQLVWETDRPQFADYARLALRSKDAWVSLNRVLDTDYNEWFRADQLESLHDLLGDDDFAAGIMPSPFPGIPESDE